MATGMPSKRGRTRDQRESPRTLVPNPQLIGLSYPGKGTVSEILSTPSSTPVLVWQGTETQHPNLLFAGDNGGILAHLLADKRVAGKVRLIYIDPPYSTQTDFHSRDLTPAYTDDLRGADFIEYLRIRLVLLRELLAENGSIYVHLDSKMVCHMKIVMDEIFGPENFRNIITRKKCNPKNFTKKQYGNVSDYILFYSKTEECLWNRPVEAWTAQRAKEYQYTEEETGRKFMKVPVHAPGVRFGETGKPWRGMLPPPGKHWQYVPSVLDEMDARGEIFWSSSGNPRRKVYLDENPGVAVQDIWMDFKDAHNQNVCITGYPTEKNPDLLRRIIGASTAPGDLVLDCFSGSGTTLAVASELERRWIGIDSGLEAIATTLKRFTGGLERMGDFTQQRLIKTEERQKQLSLVAVDEFLEQSAVPRDHKPVVDFQLLSDPHLKAGVERIVEGWSGPHFEVASKGVGD
jgi:adenine-specific DNA-methyltransferase